MKTRIRNKKTILLAIVATVYLGYFQLAYAGGGRPIQPQAELLQQAVDRYAEIAQSGGWIKISADKKQYKKGDSAPAIRQVKQRLAATGDYSKKDTSSLYTAELEAAVKKVQRQFGFPQNGIVEAAFVKALNVPAAQRLKQLQVNVQRAQSSRLAMTGKQIVVNIPEYKLYVYENGQTVLDMNVVIGKPSSKTEVFDSELTRIVFSPYWNVPSSIVRNEILPAMRKRKNYLAANGYEITGHENGLPKIRQKPGVSNSLGLVKFLFPNEHDIYFHDTPAKGLFRQRTRAYSHGCIRLAEPEKLAEYLLKNDAAWTPAKINMAMFDGKESWVKLASPFPVSITYFTAWVDKDGELHFRDDIYRQDEEASPTVLNK